MLAVWRHWGLDAVLYEAWKNGVVLAGSSAGMICWFNQGVTDSLEDSLTAMEGLGFLPGSACPHYDAENERRPAYHRMVGSGELLSGFAADDGAALHFIDDKLGPVVSARPNARAYRVERYAEGIHEKALEVRTLF